VVGAGDLAGSDQEMTHDQAHEAQRPPAGAAVGRRTALADFVTEIAGSQTRDTIIRPMHSHLVSHASGRPSSELNLKHPEPSPCIRVHFVTPELPNAWNVLSVKRHPKLPASGERQMLGTILLIVLILLLVGALPTWGHSRSWGYGPSSTLGVILIIIIILVLLGRI